MPLSAIMTARTKSFTSPSTWRETLYSFRVENAEFFALDSNYMDPAQMDWLRVQTARLAGGVEDLLFFIIVV